MKRAIFVPAFALAALLGCVPASAGAPDGAFGNNSHPPADFKWAYDGTRDAIAVHLKQALGKEPNPFGALEGGDEGVLPPDSKLLGDFMPHILGLPGPEVALAKGEYFYSGAEPHDAMREAAVITQDRGGAVLALAILQTNYDKHPAVKQLTIMVPDGKVLDPAMRAAFTGWARGEIGKSNAILKGSPLSKIIDKLDVQTRSVGG